jgi:hypothetical protein
MRAWYWLESLKGILTPRWEDNIKMDVKEIEANVDRIHQAQYRGQWLALVNMVMIPEVP